MKDIIAKLKKVAESSDFNTIDTVYMVNPVKVGTTPTGDAFCVYYSAGESHYKRKSHPQIVLEVLYNLHDDALYGTNYDFAPVIYFDVNKGVPLFLSEKRSRDYSDSHSEITMLPNALELVLAEVESFPSDWIEYTRQLKEKSHNYLGRAVSAFDERKKNFMTWDERVEWTKVKGEIERLMWRRPKNYELELYEKMMAAGQEKFEREEREGNERVKLAMAEYKKNKNG